MKRNQFIKDIGLFACGLSFMPPKWSFSDLKKPLQGYLMPISIDYYLENKFQKFKVEDLNKSSSELVDEGIGLINNLQWTPKKYPEHYRRIVLPQKNLKLLNGKGIDGTDSSLMTKMNDENVRAQTPLHHVRDLKTFSQEEWSSYCDIASLQTAEDDGGKKRIYVKPLDSREDKYQVETWVPENISYLLYNPKFYCYGLPIEDPVKHDVDTSLQRQIIEKTGRKATVSHFFRQTFFFQGSSACSSPQESTHTIWWDHDDVIKEFYGLVEIKGCGDPASLCKGSPHSSRRPDIIPGKN